MKRAIPTAKEFVWTDEYKLGHAAMDDTHREFVELVGGMERANDADFPALFHRFVDHAQRHFELEKTLMSDGDFPAKDCHVEEHDKVLASVLQVKPLVDAGRIDIGRSLVQALREWFPAHADYLDSALAQWLVKRSAGGVPLVLKRRGKVATD